MYFKSFEQARKATEFVTKQSLFLIEVFQINCRLIFQFSYCQCLAIAVNVSLRNAGSGFVPAASQELDIE